MNTTLKDQRRAARYKDEAGFWVSELIPEDKHGTSSGYVIYLCHCAECRKWAVNARSETSKRRAINDDVLGAQWRDQLREQIRNEVIDELNLCAKCAGTDEPAPPAPLKSVPPPVQRRVRRDPAPKPSWSTPKAQPPAQAPAQTSPVVVSSVVPVDPERAREDLAVNGDHVSALVANQIKVGSIVRDAGKVPPVVASVRTMIKTVATLDAIGKAYYEPDWVAPVLNGRERRAAGTMEVIVDPNGDKPVIAFHEREIAEGKPELVAEKKTSIPKAKGTGGGTQGPKTWDGLKEALKKIGADFEVTGTGHLKVSKAGKSIILPSTSSDWRGIRNSLAQARREGLL